jgi:predicted amidophosphoribosyltransferase
LKGNWDNGLAVDLHTLKSTPVGVNEYGHIIFDTTYTRLGELVNKCKYHNDKSVIPEIVNCVAPVVGVLGDFDVIIPVPPSNVRSFQPVSELAKLLGERLKISQLDGCFNCKPHSELKGISDPERRTEILRSSISIAQIPNIKNRSILVFDDLYRSGATLRVVCDLLRQYEPARLCVLCLTKTRSNR